MNRALAIHIIEQLIEVGVEEFILCPGARNAPFVNLISNSPLKHTYGYEERSSAFYALGLARKSNRPVAVVSTSGTAVGELLPAAMEAYYTSVPLILVTADRPRHYRGCNAPQSCEQVGLYGCYAETIDFAGNERHLLNKWSGRVPLHLNVCFEEPQNEEIPYPFNAHPKQMIRKLPEGDLSVLNEFFKDVEKPLVIVSTLAKKDRPAVIRFLEKLKCPVYLEGVSGIRTADVLKPFQIIHPKLDEYDAVLRIGGVPTHRIWRDIENQKGIKALSISEHPFSGLTFAPLIWTEIGKFLSKAEINVEFNAHPQDGLQTALLELIREEPEAEQSLIHQLSLEFPEGSLVYLGNSLPIRNWDLTASYTAPALEVQASRGLNGIDGQLSCFFGLCDSRHQNFAIIGDLTALYDFAAGWFPLKRDIPFTLFVINNRGGKIFSRLFNNPVFQHPHGLDFEHFAKFWNMPYQLWEQVPSNPNLSGLIELVPDPEATARFSKKWEHYVNNNSSTRIFRNAL